MSQPTYAVVIGSTRTEFESDVARRQRGGYSLIPETFRLAGDGQGYRYNALVVKYPPTPEPNNTEGK